MVCDGGHWRVRECVVFRQFVWIPEEICFDALLVPLPGAEVVYEGVIVVLTVSQAERLLVGQAEVFGGIVDDAAGHILIRNAIDVDPAADAFEFVLLGVIRKMGGGDLEMEQLVGLILIFVNGCFEPAGGLVLQVGMQGAVSDPVEKEEAPKQYGS